MAKTLVIVRHAHRDKSQGREVDNGLSKKGWKQADTLLEFYRSRFGKVAPLIYSSGKLRCVETVEPIAKKFKVEIATSPLLMERGGFKPKEDPEEFISRVLQFVSQWKKTESAITIASTHGDWIPALMKELFNSETELKKGGWIEVSENAKILRLDWLVQEFL